MKKNIYLHIGTNKTGSSAIQSFLNTNESLLNLNNIHYCSTGKIWNAHFPLAWELGCGKSALNYNEKNLWEKAKLEFENKKEENIIISSENFVLLRDTKKMYYIKNLLQNYNIYILLYIRRQDLWVESLYLQSIKMGNNVNNFEKYCNNCGQELDFYKFLQPWEEVFGENNIKVLNFDNAKKNIIDSFLTLIGNTKIPLPPAKNKIVNETITRELAEFLIRFNPVINSKKRQEIISFYNKFIKSEDSLNTKFFNINERLKFLSKYNQSNNLIARKYFKKDQLFDQSMPDTNSVIEYTKEEIEEIIESLIQKFLNKKYKLQE